MNLHLITTVIGYNLQFILNDSAILRRGQLHKSGAKYVSVVFYSIEHEYTRVLYTADLPLISYLHNRFKKLQEKYISEGFFNSYFVRKPSDATKGECQRGRHFGVNNPLQTVTIFQMYYLYICVIIRAVDLFSKLSTISNICPGNLFVIHNSTY